MIGVKTSPSERDTVQEFFELLKTPWEFYRCGRPYDVVLATSGEGLSDATAPLIVVYSTEHTQLDRDAGLALRGSVTTSALAYGADRLPIYGPCLTFRGQGIGLTVADSPDASVACAVRTEHGLVVRVGYDLFREVRWLLTRGQPVANAGIPTLERHIALLRELVSWSGIPLVEIPPVPPGHALIACLTHDVDHPSVRRHKWDHTALGFLYRACVGSVIKVCRRRAAVRDLLANWAAAARLPLVHLGIARDFWGDWTRYAAVDGGTGSTFFVIPVGDYPGQTPFSRSAPAHRAARYGAEDIAEQIRSVTASGCEIAVHGIDAWLDSSKGREELAEVSRVAGATATGVRMHWLYGHETSPLVLEEAGFTYDSTSGYNETIGYRAGTTQVFKPLAAKRLLELPMHVMDTALFYPRHLDLAPAEATRRVTAIIDDAVRFGGIVTINWHDRSMAPERQWGRVYGRLLRDLRRRGAWFPTASQAVSWFRKRRSAVFQAVSWDGDVVSARIGGATSDGLPGLRLRVHRPETYWDGRQLGVQPSIGYVEVSVNDTIDTSVRL